MDYLIIEEKSQVKEVYKIFVRTFITLDRTLKNFYLCMYNNYKNNANYVSKQGNILSSIYIVNLTRFAQSQAKILCCYNGTRSLCFSSALRVLRSPETIKLTNVRQFSISLLYQLRNYNFEIALPSLYDFV